MYCAMQTKSRVLDQATEKKNISTILLKNFRHMQKLLSESASKNVAHNAAAKATQR